MKIMNYEVFVDELDAIDLETKKVVNTINPHSYITAKNDAFPLTLLESLSYCVSVIATNEGSIPYILDEQSGIILNDVKKLKEALEQARKQLLNKETAMYCRQRYLDNFSLEQFEDNLVNNLKG